MRRQIADIAMERMPNMAHYEFVYKALGWANECAALVEGCKADIDALQTALDEEDRCLNISKKSALTEKITEQDALRDAAYMGLKGAVKAFLNFPAGDVLDAAKTLWQVLVDYAVDTREQLDRETGRMRNLSQELDKHSEEVSKLSVGTLVTQMKESNEQVGTMMAERDTERSAIVVGETKAARAAVDEAYRELVVKTNAHAVLDGETAYATFIDQMNEMIERYKREVIPASSSKKSPTTEKKE